jgi:nicotinamide riboside kinase
MTKVICLYGGPGTGKSTGAASLFALMKTAHYDVELVREYVKNWAYSKKEVGVYDQLYITAKQAKAEYDLYDKVNWIITDSPIILGGFYSEHYNGLSMTPVILELMNKAKSNEIEYEHYFIQRNKPYNPNGRYQNEEQARELDGLMKMYLTKNGIKFTTVNSVDEIWNKIKETP